MQAYKWQVFFENTYKNWVIKIMKNARLVQWATFHFGYFMRKRHQILKDENDEVCGPAKQPKGPDHETFCYLGTEQVRLTGHPVRCSGSLYYFSAHTAQ